MRKLFRHLTFPHFILNCLIGVLKHSLNSLNSRLRQVMGNRKCINIFRNTAFWWHRIKHLHFFSKNSSQETAQHLTICCYFEVGNLIVLLTQPLFGLIYIFQNMNLILSVRFYALYGGGELQKSYKRIYHLTIKRLGGQFDSPLWFFQKLFFFVTFNIIIRSIFPENFIVIPQIIHKIWIFSSILTIFISSPFFLTLSCYKNTNDVNI